MPCYCCVCGSPTEPRPDILTQRCYECLKPVCVLCVVFHKPYPSVVQSFCTDKCWFRFLRSVQRDAQREHDGEDIGSEDTTTSNTLSDTDTDSAGTETEEFVVSDTDTDTASEEAEEGKVRAMDTSKPKANQPASACAWQNIFSP